MKPKSQTLSPSQVSVELESASVLTLTIIEDPWTCMASFKVSLYSSSTAKKGFQKRVWKENGTCWLTRYPAALCREKPSNSHVQMSRVRILTVPLLPTRWAQIGADGLSPSQQRPGDAGTEPGGRQDHRRQHGWPWGVGRRWRRSRGYRRHQVRSQSIWWFFNSQNSYLSLVESETRAAYKPDSVNRFSILRKCW